MVAKRNWLFAAFWAANANWRKVVVVTAYELLAGYYKVIGSSRTGN